MRSQAFADMTHYSQNVKIRINIMLIALIGGMSFFGYVLFNVSVANDNEHRITELEEVKLPVLQTLLTLKQDVEDVHTAFSTALVFENYFLLDETLESANAFLTHINELNKIDRSTLPFTDQFTQAFDDYYLASKSVANLLIKHPEKSREYEDDLLKINQQRNLLIADIDQIIELRKQDYVTSLAYTNQEIVSANRLGAIMGGLLIVGLVIFAWLISVRVIRAVNQTDRLKKVFLDTMSHEMRTPINGIAGSLSLLKTTSLTQEQSELVDACKLSEHAITSSIDDILEFSGMVSGNINIAQHPFSIKTLVDNTNKLFADECMRKHITLSTSYHEQSTAENVYLGDEQRLGHALRHIIGNAVKFSDHGPIAIHISTSDHRQSTTHQTITICVTDEGPGIPSNKLEDVFKPFHQIDGSFSRQHQGIGIGIPMCASIAKAMNGSLEIKNRSTKGTKVTFQFVAEQTNQSIYQPPAHKKPVTNNQDINVLIVEDNEVNQLVLKSFVEKMGFKSKSAINGQVALDLLVQHDFSIVLMDCQMPVMDGFDATKEIRRRERGNSHIPIIAVTANAMEGDRERCLAAGMDDYLKKPVSMEHLRNSMNQLLFNEA